MSDAIALLHLRMNTCKPEHSGLQANNHDRCIRTYGREVTIPCLGFSVFFF